MGIGLTGNLLTYALLDGAAPGTIPASKDSSIYLRQAGDVSKDVCLGPMSLRNSS
jgi:hypothetical protein